MKRFIFLILSISTSVAYSQRDSEICLIKRTIKLESNRVYIFCRGTKSKSGLIAEKFNIADRNTTHIGLGFIKNNKLLIYHVTDTYSYENALRIDSIDSFINSADVYFISIWQCNINLNKSNKIKSTCAEYNNRKIFFDVSFTISDNDTLYCSEFCATVFKKSKIKKLDFPPVTIKLNNSLYESILNRKNLYYFPVDFFQTNKFFTKVFEYKFSH